jgi:hypothetical protein
VGSHKAINNLLEAVKECCEIGKGVRAGKSAARDTSGSSSSHLTWMDEVRSVTGQLWAAPRGSPPGPPAIRYLFVDEAGGVRSQPRRHGTCA